MHHRKVWVRLLGKLLQLFAKQQSEDGEALVVGEVSAEEEISAGVADLDEATLQAEEDSEGEVACRLVHRSAPQDPMDSDDANKSDTMCDDNTFYRKLVFFRCCVRASLYH